MKFNNFIPNCKHLVAKYNNDRVDKVFGFKITTDDVFVVWFSKTLQNAKALLSTTLHDGMYYEITYNGDKDEFYLDAYKKVNNLRITTEEVERK